MGLICRVSFKRWVFCGIARNVMKGVQPCSEEQWEAAPETRWYAGEQHGNGDDELSIARYAVRGGRWQLRFDAVPLFAFSGALYVNCELFWK